MGDTWPSDPVWQLVACSVFRIGLFFGGGGDKEDHVNEKYSVSYKPCPLFILLGIKMMDTI